MDRVALYRHKTERVSSLTLASTPSPQWKPPCHIERYLKQPKLWAPAFVLTSPIRLHPEVATAFPYLKKRLRFEAQQLWQAVEAQPMSPTVMAQRFRLSSTVNFSDDCAKIVKPTQIITGKRHLDRVVSVDNSREYLKAIPGAKSVQIDGTGHIGLVTKPNVFADIVVAVAQAHAAYAGMTRVRHLA